MVAVLLLGAPDIQAQRAGQRAAASESKLATREAMRQLRSGGNAMDAAVTAALVGGVTSPTSSGIGGGGFAVVWDAAKKQAVVLDFRETAPKAIDTAAFEKRPFAWDQRGKYVGVPGEVAGLYAIHKRWGKRKWKDVVAPAARIATTGYKVGRHLGKALKAYQNKLAQDAGLARIFYPRGRPAPYGALLKNEALGKTLEAIAARGPKAFYEGDIAKDIVATTRGAGGALTLADLKAYQVKERKPLHKKWEGYDVHTMPAPSAGGMMLVQTLSLYKKAYLEKLGRKSGAYYHMLAESMRASVADRMRYVGDPDFAKFDMKKLTGDKRMAVRRQSLALDRTHGMPRFGLEEHGTHHLVTSDSSGNMVSLTTTVNRVFGAKLTTATSGIVLNDELDDFTPVAAVTPFGMTKSPNRPRPGARPVSSMTPTIVVQDGKAVLALGGSGGMTIATNVTQATLLRLAFGLSPRKVTASPRFAIPTRGAYLSLQKGEPEALRKDLTSRGEIVNVQTFDTHAIQMIAVEKGRKQAAGDARKHASASVE